MRHDPPSLKLRQDRSSPSVATKTDAPSPSSFAEATADRSIPATGKKEDSEVSEARALLASPEVKLENALLTADPLHNKEATMRVIVEKGGDYLVGTKGNTSVRHEAVEKSLEGTPFLT